MAGSGKEYDMLETERLLLRKWTEEDADSLFEYAKDPEVGPIAGWPPHRSREESLDVIRNVLNGRECYAICEKGNPKAIGAIELILNRHNDTENHDEEWELGYWLGKPFWGRGYMPEAAREMIRHGFEDLGMNTIWCGYFEGNQKSKRVQEKIGFVYHHTREDVYKKQTGICSSAPFFGCSVCICIGFTAFLVSLYNKIVKSSTVN